MKTKIRASAPWMEYSRFYFRRFDALFGSGVFEGISRVLIAGGGKGDAGGLILLSQKHGIVYSIECVEIQEGIAKKARSWLDENFSGHSVAIMNGDAVNLTEIRRAQKLPKWDLMIDIDSSAIATAIGEGKPEKAIRILKAYAGNLTAGGKLMVSKDFNQTGSDYYMPFVNEVNRFLASEESPFREKMVVGRLVVYEKKTTKRG